MIRAFALALALMILAAGAAALGSAYLTQSCKDLPAGRAFDTAVVLGAGATLEDQLEPSSRGRTLAAVDLYERGVVRHLHFTGARSDPGPSVAELMRDLALARGVPHDAVSVETISLSTLENALFSRPQLAQGESLLLVSEGYHLWRGAASFAWAARPVAEMCKSAPFERDTWRFAARATAREAAAWLFNIARGSIWSAAGAIGLQDRLPTVFLQ